MNIQLRTIPWRRIIVDALLLAAMILASSTWITPR